MVHEARGGTVLMPQSEYHFSCGNSNRGTIGFCASVKAESRQEAVELLAGFLPTELTIPVHGDAVLYVQIYLNPDRISVRHIDEVLE